MASSSPSIKIIAEYAKSNRSSCKKCTEAISSKSLRLGLVSRDPRGYDATKWHHVTCFPFDEQPIGSVEKIDGFALLKSEDREAVKNLVVECDQEEGNEEKNADGHEDKNTEESKIRKADKIDIVDGAESSSKKSKFAKEPELQTASSKIIVEYAKSSRSCKKCSEIIPAKSLRLGLVSRDPRGYDATKWHHLKCFPIDSHPVDSVEKLHGFALLGSGDQETLKKLVSACDHEECKDGEKVVVESFEEKSKKESKFVKETELQAASSKIIVEYAKSSRSSCKKCSEIIPAKSLRLGLVSRDPRGYDATKWHHLNCFPIDLHPVDSVEKLDGFTLLGSDDQETLKKLVSACDPEEGSAGEKVDVDALTEEKSGKESKLSPSDKEAEIDIEFSMSDVSDTYKDATLLPKWKAFQTLIFNERYDGFHDSRRIAAFDFDGCLVNTSVQRVGPNAWSLLYPTIPEKLKSLYKDGYKLVIFTNEANIDRWKNKRQLAVDSKLGRVNNFLKHVNVPMQVFIACGSGKVAVDPFRKPKPGMWRMMEQHFNRGIKIDMDESFYVGDAAGRATDHSAADIEFAKAIGLKFHLPEDYFAV